MCGILISSDAIFNANIYRLNFTCNTCKSEIVPEELVEGKPATITGAKLSFTVSLADIVTLICYREHIFSIGKDKKTGKPYSKTRVDSASVSKMLSRPMKRDKSFPGINSYNKVLETYGSNQTTFEAAYSDIILLAASDEAIHHDILAVEKKANPY